MEPVSQPIPDPLDHQGDGNDAREDTPMAFRGSLTVPEAYAAALLAQPLGNKIAMWIIRGFFVVALIYMCWLAAYSYVVGEYNLSRMALAGVVFVLAPICFAVGRDIWHRRRAYKLYRDRKETYAFTEGEANFNSIVWKNETGASTLHWSAFCGYREAGGIAILYMRFPDSYAIMARSAFASDQDWTGFLQLVSQKLKQI